MEAADDLSPDDVLYFKQLDLLTKLDNIKDVTQQENEIIEFIKRTEYLMWQVSCCPKLNFETSWINSEPLELKPDLRNNVVVLDFFTYCCINCIHILPTLEKLEKDHLNDCLTIIGIHSPKFKNEKVEANVENAVHRYGITHPVYADDGSIWNALSISCWPTVLLLTPLHQVLFRFVGENIVNQWLSVFTRAVLKHYSSMQVGHQVKRQICVPEKKSSNLRYPGKVSLSVTNDALSIADTGNDRVIVTDYEGKVTAVVGGHEKGFRDGSFRNARFSGPQGMAWTSESVLFVADTGNHAIRKVDLLMRRVTTVVGDGSQGTDVIGGHDGREQSLNSPWDLCYVEDKLFIAMAGCHQIWVYALEDTTLLGKQYRCGTCFAFAGSSAEENRNNSYPHKAGFAQPSGLSYAPEDNSLYVADSESSTVRQLILGSGAVKPIVGGSKDPSDLFAFGDRDGISFNVRLQHPLDVAYNLQDKTVFVIDSYNHKVKEVSIENKECISIIGTGEPGDACGSFLSAQLNEPGGICYHQEPNVLFVADTNNHAVKRIYLNANSVTDFQLVWPQNESKASSRNVDKEMIMDSIDLTFNSSVEVQIEFTANEFEINKDAPNSVELTLPENLPFVCVSSEKQSIKMIGETVTFKLSPNSSSQQYGDYVLNCHATLYLCRKSDGTCTARSYILSQPVSVLEKDSATNPRVVVSCPID